MEEKVRDAEADSLEVGALTMGQILTFVDCYCIDLMRDGLKRLRRAVARPNPDYKEACICAVVMMSNLQTLYYLLSDLRSKYDEERAQGQGPRMVCPTSPVEDDPA